MRRVLDRIISVAELAEIHGRSPGTIRRWLRRGRLPRARNALALGVWESELARLMLRDAPLIEDAEPQQDNSSIQINNIQHDR
jgi:transposase-like protein